LLLAPRISARARNWRLAADVFMTSPGFTLSVPFGDTSYGTTHFGAASVVGFDHGGSERFD
jgi:hypothetical protein